MAQQDSPPSYEQVASAPPHSKFTAEEAPLQRPPYAYPQQAAATAPMAATLYGPGPAVLVPMQAPSQIYVVQNLPPQLGPHQQVVVCHACQARVLTRLEHEIGQKTHLAALIMCAFTGCCCIPYLLDMCKTPAHYCPNCNVFLGNYHDDKC